jgi:nitrogen regulatory protein PII-like uncharacterized protein
MATTTDIKTTIKVLNAFGSLDYNLDSLDYEVCKAKQDSILNDKVIMIYADVDLTTFKLRYDTYEIDDKQNTFEYEPTKFNVIALPPINAPELMDVISIEDITTYKIMSIANERGMSCDDYEQLVNDDEDEWQEMIDKDIDVNESFLQYLYDYNVVDIDDWARYDIRDATDNVYRKLKEIQ